MRSGRVEIVRRCDRQECLPDRSSDRLVHACGADESSRFTEEATLELVRNAGITVYTIGLKGAAGSRRARRHLEQLAEQSGGRAFLLESPAQLAEVYQTIEEELRSRYFLAYQSTNDKALEDGGGDFREIRVEVDGAGLTATTMRGYVP